MQKRPEGAIISRSDIEKRICRWDDIPVGHYWVGAAFGNLAFCKRISLNNKGDENWLPVFQEIRSTSKDEGYSFQNYWLAYGYYMLLKASLEAKAKAKETT